MVPRTPNTREHDERLENNNNIFLFNRRKVISQSKKESKNDFPVSLRFLLSFSGLHGLLSKLGRPRKLPANSSVFWAGPTRPNMSAHGPPHPHLRQACRDHVTPATHTNEQQLLPPRAALLPPQSARSRRGGRPSGPGIDPFPRRGAPPRSGVFFSSAASQRAPFCKDTGRIDLLVIFSQLP